MATSSSVGNATTTRHRRSERQRVPVPGHRRRLPGLRPDTWTHRFGRLRGRLGLAVRLHDVRHFVATTLLTSGVDLATVAGRLGHGGGGRTALSIYSHFLREPDRLASDLMARVLERKPAKASSSPPS